MRRFLLIALSAVLTTLLSAQPASTFFSTFDAERGNALAPARDGNLWLGGMTNERILFTRITPGGKILEEHSFGFDAAGLDTENLVEFFEETDGTLVGCGNFENDNQGRGFVFRFDPVMQQRVWAYVVRSGGLNYLSGIAPLGPGGDYVLYGNPHFAGGDDIELLRLDRNTGQIVTGKTKRFGIGSSDNISQIVYHNGALYACGYMTNDGASGSSNPAKMRNALYKLDTATLQPVWTRIGPFSSSASARLYGRDLIIDNEAIISTYSGDATGPDLFSSTIFLQKNDLAGNLLWAKQYNLPVNGEFAEEVIALPDGYMLYAHELLSDTSALFLLKTDKQGNPVSAVKIDYDANEEFAEIPARSKILRFGDALFLTAISQNNLGQTQGILARTDLDGWVGDSCGFFKKTTAQLVAMPAPVSEAVVPPTTGSPATLTLVSNSATLPDLIFSKKCGASGTCTTLPDLRLTMDSLVCTNGDPLLYYSLCNVGGQPYEGSAFFGMYDKNPLTDTAQLLTVTIHTDLALAPGDCEQGIVASMPFPPIPFQLDTFPLLYALLGMNLNSPTPITLSSFPFSPNSPECLYINNLDSIEVPARICGTCENPTTFVKKLGSPDRRELAYSMCASRDGNLYLAGQQGDNPMIAKLTPDGEPIWVRNFPLVNPNEPLALAQVIEDSEGKIVFCGTEGASPSTRRAIIVRYDPVAGQVLWAKTLTIDQPEASGIVEKEPGGNFVLRSNFQAFVSGDLKARSELRELDRSTGEPVAVGVRVRYEGVTSVRLESTVSHEGNLYNVGSWRVGNTSRPLMIQQPTLGAVGLMQLTNPDTTTTAPPVFAYTDILEEFDNLVIAGIGQKNPNSPSEGLYVYLEKRNTDGSLAWLKRYDISLSPQDVVSLPNAYAIFGWMPGQEAWGMIKTDRQGNLLEARTLTLAANLNSSAYYPNRHGRMLVTGGHVLMTDHSQANSTNDIVLLKTDLHFNLDDSCDLLRKMPVEVRTMPAKLELTTIETRVMPPTPLPNKNIVFQPDSLSVIKLCPRCDCEGIPDVTFKLTRIACAADSSLEYRAEVCNLGLGALSGPFEVTFFDKNPLTQAAQAVWSVSVNVPLAPGQCKEITWPLPAAASQYPKLYTLAGVGSGVTTPVSISGFPFPQGVEECRYTNNLDSFVVKTPVCDGCENPTTFVKTMGRADQSEFGYSLCTASDGNVYMAGRQGDNPMIAKMTPNGEMLWVRNFPSFEFPFGDIDLVEIIEDSEGQLVLCGTRNHSPGFRKVVAMRYDPAAGKVLWFKQYAELNPEALGIFEKTAGGNFVVYGFSDEEFGSGGIGGTYYRSRSQLWELDRTTGEVVPVLATLFPGNPSTNVYFQDMVPHQGSLYCVGAWSDENISNSGRAMLTKLSATDGTPEWIRGTLPDTAVQFRLFNWRRVLVDNGQLMVMGNGLTDINLPTQKTYIFLSKYDLDGTLLWLKSYQSELGATDIVALPEGYAIFGRAGNLAWGVLKTDKDGNLLTAKKLNLPTTGPSYQFFRQNQLLRLPNHLMMLTDFKAGEYNDLVLLKTDYDFNLDDSCSLLRLLPVQVATRAPTTNLLAVAFQPYAVTAANQTTVFQPDSLNIRQLCPKCPCTDKPDLTFRADSIYCTPDGGAAVVFQACNEGLVAAPTGFNLTFYDKNPLAGAAVPLFSTFVAVQPGFGDCVAYTLALDTVLLKYPKLYTLAGLWKDVQTPITLSDFPFPNGYAECDYANNLDSFEVNIATPVPLNLGPDRSICQGQTVTLDAGSGYAAYQWLNGGPATQTLPVSASGTYIAEVADACGRTQRDTVRVTVSPKFEATKTITFYPGDTITIDGEAYTQSGTVVQNFITAAGCDSVVTNILQLVVTEVKMTCPANLTVTLPPNQTTTVVDYGPPTATTNCPDPNITLKLIQGLPVGGNFPQGATLVCYEAANRCGIRDTCCFSITAQQPDPPCDVKSPTGCIRYDLLGIRLDAQGQPRYRVRFTNTCASPLEFAYIQLPNGVLAVSPKEGATYTAPGGNDYAVRNPNASPFYSVRYKAVAGSLNNGESDIFEYTLPQQSAPAYIRVAARLIDGTYSEAHLNTYNCPVLPYQGTGNRDMSGTLTPHSSLLTSGLTLWPNPTEGTLFVDVNGWQSQILHLQVLNAQGQTVLSQQVWAENGRFELALPEGLASGLYYLVAQSESGQQSAARFVLER